MFLKRPNIPMLQKYIVQTYGRLGIMSMLFGNALSKTPKSSLSEVWGNNFLSDPNCTTENTIKGLIEYLDSPRNTIEGVGGGGRNTYNRSSRDRLLWQAAAAAAPKQAPAWLYPAPPPSTDPSTPLLSNAQRHPHAH